MTLTQKSIKTKLTTIFKKHTHMINTEIKHKVIAALKVNAAKFGASASKYATSLGINAAQLSRILKGETEKVLSEAAWVSLARKMNVSLTNEKPWRAAATPTYIYVSEMLKSCQQDSLSALICDLADIGKTFTAKHFCKENKFAVYIDCSQYKSKQKLVRSIAKEFGTNNTGKYADVYDDLVYYLQSLANPLVVLDEAGDLGYEAFLELKALWNATEGSCGWVMMGADGLKEKVRRAIDNKKVGYTELFSRYGQRYQRITPEGKEDSERFIRQQAALIIKANAPDADVQAMVVKTNGSLRRIKHEVSKLSVTV
jgi:DNA transposition AAA+ family ATPase